VADFPGEGFTPALLLGEGVPAAIPATGFLATPDVNPPEIENFVPAPGSEIERTQPLQFDVVDDSAEDRRTFVWISYPGTTITVQELVWDGTGFTPDYAAYSTRTAIVGGFRYVIRRRSGWSASIVTVHVVAIDPSGGVSA
jgi:hypothetical protein